MPFSLLNRVIEFCFVIKMSIPIRVNNKPTPDLFLKAELRLSCCFNTFAMLTSIKQWSIYSYSLCVVRVKDKFYCSVELISEPLRFSGR